MRFLRLKSKDESFAVEVISQLKSGNSLYACRITHTTALGNLFLSRFLFLTVLLIFPMHIGMWGMGECMCVAADADIS